MTKQLAGKMVLSAAAPRQTGPLVRCRSRAAPAAAGVKVASSRVVRTPSSAPSSTPVGSGAADGAPVRHETSPVKRLS
jgi:hypothetical protein